MKHSISLFTTIHSIAYGNGIFVIVGEYGKILTSENGSTWSTQISNVTSN
jgi:hypothetical protein